MHYIRTVSLLLPALLFQLGCQGTPQDELAESSSTNRAGTVPERATKGTAARLKGFQGVRLSDQPNETMSFSFEHGKAVVNSTLLEIVGDEHGGDGRAMHQMIASDEELRQRTKDAYDIAFDATHGLIANASDSGWEFGFGEGGIQIAGDIPLNEVRSAPVGDYESHLRIDALQAGRSYLVRTSNGMYAKFCITEFDSEKGELTFDWYLQADGSTEFSE